MVVCCQRCCRGFGSSEEPPTADRRKPEDDECELFYQYNTARCPSGRFVTRLPFLPNRPALGWIKRFVNNCRKPQAERNFTPVLSPAERNAALCSLVRVVQAEHFEEELKNTQLFGKCRYCLDFGHHEEIEASFYRNGVQQTYRQTFLETFNLCLSRNACLPNLICQSCIGRLTDAAEFKAMVEETERYLLTSTETTSNIEFVNVAQLSAQEEENVHQNDIMKKEEDEIIEQEDVNPSGSVGGEAVCQRRLQVKLTRLPDKLFKLYSKRDFVNKSADAENEVAICNEESSALKTEQIEQEDEQDDNVSNRTEREDNIGEEEIDEQDPAIDNQANAVSTTPDLKLKRTLADHTHVQVEHTHTGSASSSKSEDNYALRTQQTATRCGINEINNIKFHIRKHTGIKPYECEICDRKFTENSYLKKHIKTHTGLKMSVKGEGPSLVQELVSHQNEN
ncbi:zinc-finger associated domain (zf-AD) domain-containing protein [Phthorimaea operculella]|nr:zinc-finger associated domain (zf-AD) domain-containing protein [Phthorimaea operculella]